MKARLSTFFLMLFVLTACNSTSTTTAQTQTNESSSSFGQSATGSPSASVVAIENETLATQVLDMRKESIYFDFDKSIIKPEFKNLLIKQAAFINAHENLLVTLEGNADERGSNEYNLELSKRRANAVRDALAYLGVSNRQLIVVGLGEEKPRSACHNEHCWGVNRRVDFIGNLGA